MHNLSMSRQCSPKRNWRSLGGTELPGLCVRMACIASTRSESVTDIPAAPTEVTKEIAVSVSHVYLPFRTHTRFVYGTVKTAVTIFMIYFHSKKTKQKTKQKPPYLLIPGPLKSWKLPTVRVNLFKPMVTIITPAVFFIK